MNNKIAPATNAITALLTVALSILCATPALAQHDPTQPLTYKPPAVAKRDTGLQLESVLISKLRRQATINGTAVKEGDHIAGNRVVAITAEGVTLSRNGKQHQLKLNTTTVKRAPSRGAK